MTMPTSKTTSSTGRSGRAAPPNANEPSSKRAKISASSCDVEKENPACHTWADLRPEIVSHVARYVSPDTADMMNFLFCVGPRVAAIVRKTYLSGNDLYLRDCVVRTPPYNSEAMPWRRV